MTLVVSGFMAMSHFYLGWRLVRIVSGNTRKRFFKWIPAILLFSFYLLPLTGLYKYIFQGYIDLMTLPAALSYWFWFGLIFSYQMLTFMIILDIVKLIVNYLKRWDRELINLIYFRTVLVTVLIVFLFSGFKLYRDTTKIQVEELALSIKGLPPSLEEFRIVHISDIQGDRYTGKKEIARYIREVNRQNADLVVFTGDLISYGTDYIEMAAEELSKVESGYGVYAVVGDHDYWAGLQYIEPALEKRGIPLLQNENFYVSVGKDSLLLSGITEVYSKKANPVEVDSLTGKSQQSRIKILASHQVSEVLINKAIESNYKLLLAGHTHGGQIHVPFMFMTFSASELETDYVSGPHRINSLLVNINNGLGFTLGPVRYNAPPGISVIKLIPA